MAGSPECEVQCFTCPPPVLGWGLRAVDPEVVQETPGEVPWGGRRGQRPGRPWRSLSDVLGKVPQERSEAVTLRGYSRLRREGPQAPGSGARGWQSRCGHGPGSGRRADC